MDGLFDTSINRIHSTRDIWQPELSIFSYFAFRRESREKSDCKLSCRQPETFPASHSFGGSKFSSNQRSRGLFDPGGASAEMTHATAMELRCMMSSEQGLERLSLVDMRVLLGIIFILPQA
jgi:hypothetical protein